jgi:hypothetical protein
MKLSQILKLSGIAVGALGALFIVYAEINVIKEHYLALIVMGIGAVIWFVGAWEAKHEAQVAAANAPKVTVTTTSGTVV